MRNLAPHRSIQLWSTLLLVSLAAPAAAVPTTYQYTGNTFSTFAFGLYSSSDSVDITITLSGPLSPNLTLANAIGSVTAYSFSDGVQTITNTTPGAVLTFFNAIDTDAFGNIVGWNAAVEIAGGNYFIDSNDGVWDEGCFTGSSFCDSSARVASNPGTWALVPEPSTALLCGLGLLVLPFLGRRTAT